MEALKPNFASKFGNSGIPPEVIRCAKNLLTFDVAKEMAVTAKRLIPRGRDETSRVNWFEIWSSYAIKAKTLWIDEVFEQKRPHTSSSSFMHN